MQNFKNKFIIGIISILIIVFILNRNKQTENNHIKFLENENQANVAPSIDPKSIKTTSNSASNDLKKVEKFEVKDDNFEAYDKMESSWLTNAKTLFDKEYFQQYLSMRESCDNEKLEAYKMYHDYLRKKYGENFKYNLSEDQSSLEKKINEKYLLKLSKLIGEDNFKNYLKARDTFNENLRRNAGENKFIIVEF